MKGVIFIHVLYLILIRTFMVQGSTECQSKVQLRAVLLSCPAKDTGCDDDDPLSQAMNAEETKILHANTKNFDALKEEKTRGFPNNVKDCKRKLVITLKVKNSGKIPCDDEFIIVDHVFDPITGQKGRLLSPVVLKLRQEQMIQLYGLKFQKVVNSDPFEEQKGGGKVCSTNLDNPTCGITTYNGKPIPFSEGFCCSCDPLVNAKRQLSLVSHGDSPFLHRNFQLTSQENSRLIREEKSSSAILNPKLVKLKSGKDSEGPCARSVVEEEEEKKGESFIKEISDKLPNFLLEMDRKIICSKGDFLGELSKIQTEKHKGAESSYSTVSTSKKNSDNYESNLVLEVNTKHLKGNEVDVDLGQVTPNIKKDSGELTSGESFSGSKDDLVLENFIGALNMYQTTKATRTYEKVTSGQVTRGKRENRKASTMSKKKLTLEEKLEKFAERRNHLTSRHKRLLELSHKRLRKAEVRCREAEECQTVMVTDFPTEDYVRVPPPKYFFSHDKYIVDPLEPSQMLSNSTCKSSDEMNYEDSIGAEYGPSLQNERVKKLNNEDKDEKPNNDLFVKSYQSVQKKENKLRGNSKFYKEDLMEKANIKEIKLVHNIEDNNIKGKIKIQNYNMPHKEKASIRNDKRIKIERERESLGSENKEAERENGGKEEDDRDENHKDNGSLESQKSQKSLLSTKNFKHLFLKSDSDKKSAKPKIRNYFTATNREKQKLRSEFVKNRKKPELIGSEQLGEEKLKEKKFKESFKDSAQEEKNQEKSEKLQNKISDGEERETQSKHADENAEPMVRTNDFSTEGLLAVSKSKENLSKEEWKQHSPDEGPGSAKEKYLLPSGMKNEENRRGGRPLGPVEGDVGSIDFDVEIIQKQYPKMSDPRVHPSKAEQFLLKQETAPFPNRAENIAHGIARKKTLFKGHQNPFLNYRSPQKYYTVENGRHNYPHVFFLPEENTPLLEVRNYRYRMKEPKRKVDQLASNYEPARTNVRLQSKHSTYLYQKPGKHYYEHAVDYSTHKEPAVKRARQNFLNDRDDSTNRAQEFQHRRVGYPEMFFHRIEDFPDKTRFDLYKEADENVRDSSREMIRTRRAAGYSFEPARGFFSSELDENPPETKTAGIVHELESCLSERKVQKSEGTKNWPNKITDWQFSRANFDSKIISTLKQLQSKLDHSPALQKKEADTPKFASKRESGGGRTAKAFADKERLIQSYLMAPDYVLENVEGGLKGKRQAARAEVSRGGGSCKKERFAGEYARDTAHCMRFGDLWYSVYMIKKPVIAQIVGVQLFDKHFLCDGTSQWRDLTKGKMVRIGTFLPKAEDDLPSISMTYLGGNTRKLQTAIDPDNYLLLIPSHVSDSSKASYYPQFEGGPAEYLVVQAKDISSGNECNMIGASFEAFAQQPHRCSRKRGSCFKRQPVDLWREDMEARIRGKRGKYFVENFGTVPNSPIKTYTNFSGEFLALEYYGDYTSTIEIEVKADYNAIVRKGSSAQIPSVYIDGTYPKKTRIILSVLNIGLTSSYFRPRLGDCPQDLDPAWCPLEGPLVVIPPQQRHDFKLDLSGVLPQHKIQATVEVLNQQNEKVAYRRILIKKGNRCLCAFHCKCSCMGNLISGRVCRKLKIEEYRDAGYMGSPPFRVGASKTTVEVILHSIRIALLTASYVLLLMGVIKGVLGIFCRRIGIAGTRIIVGPRKLCRYYEHELQCCSVLFDECGFPVHPTTCLPVQIVPLWVEILLNCLFFFLYPIRGIGFIIMSCPCCKIVCAECDGYCQQEESTASRPLLSETHHTCVNYNLTTLVTKKSLADEYQPYLPYKGDEDPLEEDDTEFVLEEMKRYRKK